jgi:hypothetical protein
MGASVRLGVGMRAFLGAGLAVCCLLGLSPANSTTFTYNVNFDINAVSVTGTIVTACNNCPLDP